MTKKRGFVISTVTWTTLIVIASVEIFKVTIGFIWNKLIQRWWNKWKDRKK